MSESRDSDTLEPQENTLEAQAEARKEINLRKRSRGRPKKKETLDCTVTIFMLSAALNKHIPVEIFLETSNKPEIECNVFTTVTCLCRSQLPLEFSFLR